jgi:hypothetical protein
MEATVITDDEIVDAIFNTANSHDSVKAVKALLAKAWDAALVEASDRGFLVAGYLAMVQSNPYRTEATP